MLDEDGFVISAARYAKEDQIPLKENEVLIEYDDYTTCTGKKYEDGKLITCTRQDDVMISILKELKHEMMNLKSELKINN